MRASPWPQGAFSRSGSSPRRALPVWGFTPTVLFPTRGSTAEDAAAAHGDVVAEAWGIPFSSLCVWADSGAELCGAAALCCVCVLPPARAIVCMCTPPSYGYGYGSCGDVQ